MRSLGISSPDPGVGTVIVTGSEAFGDHVNVSARIEPDADGDGYGDLTQDICPTLKNSHDDCTPPDTILTSGPPKKVVTAHKSVKVTIAFVATESGTTLSCRVDRGAAAPCLGRLTVKLKPGKHTLTVTATDAVGNVEPAPLTVSVKVTHRKRH